MKGEVNPVLKVYTNLIIENNTSSFSVTELEYYLADFKNSLWMLILDNNSVAKAGVLKETPNIFSQDVLHLFHGFIVYQIAKDKWR